VKSLWGQQTTSARMNSQGVSTIILSLQPTRTIHHQMSITSKTLIKGPDVWTHKDFKHNLDWISHWEDKEIEEIFSIVERWRQAPCPVTEMDIGQNMTPCLSHRFQAISQEIEGGKGFYLLRGLPISQFTAAEAQVISWVLSNHLGVPQGQDKLKDQMELFLVSNF